MPDNSADNTLLLHCLSQLTLNPGKADDAIRYLNGLSPEGREHFESVADSNHVVVRALQVALPKLEPGSEQATWAQRSDRPAGAANPECATRVATHLHRAGGCRMRYHGDEVARSLA